MAAPRIVSIDLTHLVEAALRGGDRVEFRRAAQIEAAPPDSTGGTDHGGGID